MMSLRLQASSAHRWRQYLGGRLARCREVAPVLPAGHAREVEAVGSTSTSDAGSPASPFQAPFSPLSDPSIHPSIGPQPQLLVDGLTKNQPPPPPPQGKGEDSIARHFSAVLQMRVTSESILTIFNGSAHILPPTTTTSDPL